MPKGAAGHGAALIVAAGGPDTSMQDFDAVIFDCDGVLVNSEELAQNVEIAHLERVGLRYDRSTYVRRFSGTTMGEFRNLIRNDYVKQFKQELPSEFFDEMAKAIVHSYEEALVPLEGVVEFVSSLQKPKAVASGSSLELARMKLERVGLAPEFGAYIFTSEQGRSKPHPDVFLQAAAALGVEPARSVVIEDSANGVMGAKRAGMFAVGYAGGGHCRDGHEQLLYDAGADVVFHSFARIADHFSGAH